MILFIKDVQGIFKIYKNDYKKFTKNGRYKKRILKPIKLEENVQKSLIKALENEFTA